MQIKVSNDLFGNGQQTNKYFFIIIFLSKNRSGFLAHTEFDRFNCMSIEFHVRRVQFIPGLLS